MPLNEVFAGQDVDELIDILGTAARDAQSLHTKPILARVQGESKATDSLFIHTVVPITDDSDSRVVRLFIYSEKAE